VLNKTSLSRRLLDQLYTVQKLSIYEISKKTSISKSTVHRRLIQYQILRRTYEEAFQIRNERGNCYRYKGEIIMNTSLAYILGVLVGDGFATKKSREGGHVIGLSVGDEKFAETFAKHVKKLGYRTKVKKYGPYKANRKPRYRSLFYSSKFFHWFKKLTTKKIEEMVTNKKEWIVAFIKGFYESEGTVGKDRKWSYLRIGNTDWKLMMLVHRLLFRLGYHFKLYGPYKKEKAKPFYRLHLGNADEIDSFLKLVNPCIKNAI